KKTVVKIFYLEKNFKEGDIVSIETLVATRIISKKDSKDGVKILSAGEITKKLIISSELLLSQTAKNAIIKAGGTIKE
ncbi:MAG: 50S ribosomal protein L15, partial [Candidatus Moranbacteria bacterium]|nr:50S ribosomal protein L15 [Candidatus Moranbacteria bacterium]